MDELREKLADLFRGWGGLSDDAEDMAYYLIQNGVTIRKGFRSDRVMPTQADADKHGYVLAKTETGMFQTVRYEKVGEFPWYYPRWWPLPRVKEE